GMRLACTLGSRHGRNSERITPAAPRPPSTMPGPTDGIQLRRTTGCAGATGSSVATGSVSVTVGRLAVRMAMRCTSLPSELVPAAPGPKPRRNFSCRIARHAFGYHQNSSASVRGHDAVVLVPVVVRSAGGDEDLTQEVRDARRVEAGMGIV